MYLEKGPSSNTLILMFLYFDHGNNKFFLQRKCFYESTPAATVTGALGLSVVGVREFLVSVSDGLLYPCK